MINEFGAPQKFGGERTAAPLFIEILRSYVSNVGFPPVLMLGCLTRLVRK